MKDIKFRVYDKRKGRIFYGKGVRIYVLDPLGRVFSFHKDVPIRTFNSIRSENHIYEILLYTGVKDKNNKPVYEGDIVKLYMDKEYECIAVIIWSAPCFMAYIIKSPEGSGIREGMGSGFQSKYVEVIGNVYENRDLISEYIDYKDYEDLRAILLDL